MTDLDLFLLAVILLLLIALTGVMAGWWRTADRADRAERQRNRALARAYRTSDDARRILRDALASPSAEVRRNAHEAQQFASLPRDATRITSVDQFLTDLFTDGR